MRARPAYERAGRCDPRAAAFAFALLALEVVFSEADAPPALAVVVRLTGSTRRCNQTMRGVAMAIVE